MSIFAIGDTHLTFSTDKPMDIFRGWTDYVERLEKNWRAVVGEEDTVVIPGDISWAMSLEQAKADFAFLDSLPGKKLIMKGNHDYWWQSITSLRTNLPQNFYAIQKVLKSCGYSNMDLFEKVPRFYLKIQLIEEKMRGTLGEKRLFCHKMGFFKSKKVVNATNKMKKWWHKS